MTVALLPTQRRSPLSFGRIGCLLDSVFLALPPPGESASGLSLKPAAPAIALRSAGAAAAGAGFVGTFRGGGGGSYVLEPVYLDAFPPAAWRADGQTRRSY